MSNLTKREAAARRRAIAAARQGLDEVPRANGPLVERDEHGVVTAVTPAGLRLVERLARQGAPQSKCAGDLGVLLKQFKILLASQRGENALRMAWEKGRGDFEFKVVQQLMKHGKHSFVPLIFVGKSVCGMQEAGQQAANVQNNVVLTLPKPRTRQAFFEMMGVQDPLAVTGQGPAPMKLIEQQPTALPAPDETESTETEPVKE